MNILNLSNIFFKLASDYIGLSAKEKRKLKNEQRNKILTERINKIKNRETYGDMKVSRRIPKHIVQAVENRDRFRDFGRPNHICNSPGPPHHIIHFEKFLNGEVEGNPHTLENLEAPCSQCHKLAHSMGIPSGTSIETFFRNKF